MIPMPEGQPLLHVQDLRVAHPGREGRDVEVATIGVRSQYCSFKVPSA